MPTGRKRSPPATRRRALELIAWSPDGMTEAMLLAHGFTVEMLVDLIRAGLATLTPRPGRRNGTPICPAGGGSDGASAVGISLRTGVVGGGPWRGRGQ